jgi:hypothetical protein
MSVKMNRCISERVELWKQFYAKKNEQPLFGFFVGSEYPVARYQAARSLPEGRPLVPSDFDVDAFCDDNDRLFAAHEACGGDFIWAADAFWGIQWIECLCGLPMFCNHKSSNLHFQTLENFSGEVPIFDPQNEWARLAAEFLDKGAARAAGRYPLATTRMRGISDMMSALYGGGNFVYQLMDEPEQTREVCRKLTELYIGFSKFQLDHIPDFHGGIGSFYYSNWAPKGTVWHQEDTAAMLSPAMYAEHFKEWDEQIVNSFENNIMHMHSTGFIPLDDYLGMNFTAMELHIDTGGPSAEALYETHKKILAKKPLLIWGDIPEKDLDWIFSKLPPQGLAVNTVVNSPEQAEILYSKYGRKK